MLTLEEAVEKAAKTFDSYEDFEYEEERANGVAAGIGLAYDVPWTTAWDLIDAAVKGLDPAASYEAQRLLDQISLLPADRRSRLQGELIAVLLEVLEDDFGWTPGEGA